MINPSTDYTARKRDISILDYPDLEAVDGEIVMPRFGKTSRFCSGTQKLIQRYAILMLTNVGSQENYPTFGSNFLWPLLAGISPSSKLEAVQIFALANYAAVTAIKNYQIENDDIPLDEQLDHTELVDLVVQGDSAAFSVKLTTLAGNLTNFLLPLPR